MPTTITREQVIEKVCELAAEQAGMDRDEVSVEMHLYNDLQFDSLDLVEFTMTIEDEYGMSITDEQAEGVKTVGNVVEVLLPLLQINA